MIKILLCGEGVTDQGSITYKNDEYVHTEGVMQVFIRKLAADNELEFAVKTRGDIKRFMLTPKQRFEPRRQLAARKLAAMAQQENCKHIVYHQDEDNRGFDKIYNQVHDLFSVASESKMRCLAIVPMHMTESWLLCDEGAFPSKPNDPVLPKKPEETWGNPSHENHPKKYLERVLAQFHKKATVEVYCEIAGNSNVETVRAGCPVSFGRLCDDIKGFL